MKGIEIVEKIKTAYNTDNLKEAYKYWTKLFDKYRGMELFDLTDKFSNDEVYAICEYGKDKYYKEKGWR